MDESTFFFSGVLFWRCACISRQPCSSYNHALFIRWDETCFCGNFDVFFLFGSLYYFALNPFDVNVRWLRCSRMQKRNASAAKDRARAEPTHSKPCETVRICHIVFRDEYQYGLGHGSNRFSHIETLSSVKSLPFYPVNVFISVHLLLYSSRVPSSSRTSNPSPLSCRNC